ncbi:unnamed protein product [Trichogramma brassicae]|uniref:Uncharacterized protein n=1 Tax=Trichogramma brassicae TaxID=86971 RepID=A0A6H5I3W0_9HYME|nr:unnamed protein product [Trichogramma brassicae]
MIDVFSLPSREICISKGCRAVAAAAAEAVQQQQPVAAATTTISRARFRRHLPARAHRVSMRMQVHWPDRYIMQYYCNEIPRSGYITNYYINVYSGGEDSSRMRFCRASHQTHSLTHRRRLGRRTHYLFLQTLEKADISLLGRCYDTEGGALLVLFRIRESADALRHQPHRDQAALCDQRTRLHRDPENHSQALPEHQEARSVRSDPHVSLDRVSGQQLRSETHCLHAHPQGVRECALLLLYQE